MPIDPLHKSRPIHSESSAQALDYRSPGTLDREEHFAFAFFRLAMIGPISGVMVSAIRTGIALIYWLMAGQPPFYFRDWVGVENDFSMLVICGALVGVVLVVMLIFYEWMFGRRIRLLPQMISVAMIATVIYLPATHLEFQNRTLFDPLSFEAVILGLALVSAIVFSTRAPRRR